MVNALRVQTVSGRQINLAEAASTETGLHRAFVGQEENVERQFLAAFVHTRGKAMHAGSGCAFVAGCVALLVPVIGWIFGPMLILASVFWLLAPQAAFKVFSKSEYHTLQRTAHTAARNAYFNVSCPACRSPWTTQKSAFFFVSDPEGLDCGVCKKRIVRNGDELAAA